jgi:hypothetical protein
MDLFSFIKQNSILIDYGTRMMKDGFVSEERS